MSWAAVLRKDVQGVCRLVRDHVVGVDGHPPSTAVSQAAGRSKGSPAARCGASAQELPGGRTPPAFSYCRLFLGNRNVPRANCVSSRRRALSGQQACLISGRIRCAVSRTGGRMRMLLLVCRTGKNDAVGSNGGRCRFAVGGRGMRDGKGPLLVFRCVVQPVRSVRSLRRRTSAC